jgi:putative hydrolase of the HAD superfamily
MRSLPPSSRTALGLLGVDSYVFTNSTATYARRVLAALGLCEAIEGIFDIEFAGGVPKPQLQPYERVLATLGRPASSVALVEDTETNLEPAAELGMVTIKLGEAPAADRHLHLPVLAGLPDVLAHV